MLRTDVIVAELQRLAKGQLENLLGARRERDVTRRRLRSLADDLDDLGTHGFEIDSETFEAAGGDAFAFMYQPEQDVLGADVIVIEEPGFLLCEDHDPSGSVGEPFKHVFSPHMT